MAGRQNANANAYVKFSEIPIGSIFILVPNEEVKGEDMSLLIVIELKGKRRACIYGLAYDHSIRNFRRENIPFPEIALTIEPDQPVIPIKQPPVRAISTGPTAPIEGQKAH